MKVRIWIQMKDEGGEGEEEGCSSRDNGSKI